MVILISLDTSAVGLLVWIHLRTISLSVYSYINITVGLLISQDTSVY